MGDDEGPHLCGWRDYQPEDPPGCLDAVDRTKKRPIVAWVGVEEAKWIPGGTQPAYSARLQRPW